MTLSPLAVLRGSQQPRVHSAPPADDTFGPDAVALAAAAGLVLDPWQEFVLHDALGERDGRWAAFEVGLVVPRQNGKGSVLEALELFALFDPAPGPPRLILHSAHEFKTSAEHFRRMRDLVDGSDRLRREVKIVRTAAGAETIELRSGARLRFVTRTGGSGRGFSADLIVLDEAYSLSAESMGAVLPTLSARPNPQVWYTSSAGSTSSDQLARLRARGMAGEDRLAYFEWSAEADDDPGDPAVWARANPALGIRIPEHFIAAERAALPAEQFARERLGVWPESTAKTAAIDPDAWATLLDTEADRGPSPSFAVATAPDRSWSAVAVAWKRPDGLAQVMLADYKPGSAWISERVAVLRERWGGGVSVDLASRGLVPDAEEPSQAVQAQAHNALADAVEARTLRHGNDKALNVSVREARWRPMGDTRVLDRKGNADISPLAAVALALHLLAQAPDYDVMDSIL